MGIYFYEQFKYCICVKKENGDIDYIVVFDDMIDRLDGKKELAAEWLSKDPFSNSIRKINFDKNTLSDSENEQLQTEILKIKNTEYIDHGVYAFGNYWTTYDWIYESWDPRDNPTYIKPGTIKRLTWI